MMYDIVASIVLYKNDKSEIVRSINSFLNCNLKIKLIIIDNSPTNIFNNLIVDNRIHYIHNPLNPGYGTSNNIAINLYRGNCKYFLILNPDIYFFEQTCEEIYKYMESNNTIGLLMPKILYPNGEIQYLAKLIPSPIGFILRRFIPFLRERFNLKFELRFSGYDKIIQVPYLSGCFMFFNMKTLELLNGFDEKIFMHMEDLDISRRSYDTGYKNIYYPFVSVFHDHLHKSFLNYANLKMYCKSYFYYFNKWGWIFDNKRRKINNKTIKLILQSN